MATTIAKNRVRFIRDLFARATNGKNYTLYNQFIADSIDPPFTGVLEGVLEGDGKLTEQGPGKYHVRYHSNHWFTFDAA